MLNFLKLSFYYDQYLDYFYKNNDVNHLNYNQHQATLFEDRFGWSDSFKDQFEKKNDIEVQEIVVNDYKLQKKWIDENSKYFFNNDWKIEYLKKQIEFYKPNIIFINNPGLDKSYYEMLKSYKIKLITYDGICSHNKNLINYSDLIISCLKSTCNFYSKNKKKVFYMPHGFDKRIIQKLKVKEIKSGALFVGNIRSVNHSKRVDLLNRVLSKTDLDIWIGDEKRRNFKNNFNELFKIKKFMLNIRKFNHLLKIKKIFKKNKGSIYGIKMYNLLNQSNLILNNHIDHTQDEMANIRSFESTGVGSCLVTDYKKNYSEFFSEDEIVLYRNNKEAAEKINYLLKNPKFAKNIAIKGMKKVHAKHLLQHRWDSLYEFLILKKEV